MSARSVVVLCLLGAAALFAILGAIGVMAMRDPYQRLHYMASPASISPVLISAAVFVQGAGLQAELESVLVAVLLIAMNAVVTHATARAARVHERGDWR